MSYTNSQYFMACCCPCLMLGNITSKFAREQTYQICNYCPSSFQIGEKGLYNCIYTCFPSLIAWPCSPFLSWHLNHQRWKIQLFYKDDERLKELNGKMYCYQSLFWPINLLDQYYYISNLYNEGSLTFDWDFELYRDQLLPREMLETFTIFIFGNVSGMKEIFLRKFMVFTSNNTQGNIQVPEGFKIPNDQIRTWIRSTNGYSGKTKFLEIWEIPPLKFSSSTVLKMMSNNSSISMYIFDPSHEESIEEIRHIFHKHKHSYHKPRLIVLLSEKKQDGFEVKEFNPAEAKRVSLENELLVWAKRQGEPWFQICVHDEDDYILLNSQIMKLIER